jgi:hypothetical protein
MVDGGTGSVKVVIVRIKRTKPKQVNSSFICLLSLRGVPVISCDASLDVGSDVLFANSGLGSFAARDSDVDGLEEVGGDEAVHVGF